MIVATSTPKTWKVFAELIKFYQKTPYSHIMLIHEDLVYQASHNSVNAYHIDVFSEENNIISVYEIPDAAVDLVFVKRQLGKKYGILQILKFILLVLTGIKLKGNGDRKFICSELIGKALRLDWVDDYTTPEQLDEYLRSIGSK